MEPLERAFIDQSDWATKLGSPLCHTILTHAARDIAEGGPLWDALRRLNAGPPQSLMPVPLRFLAACHRAAIEGVWPELATHYPSCGGNANGDAAWQAIRHRVAADPEAFAAAMPANVQTNETRRSCALLPGFLAIARHTGLPLRLLEIGASAGLNLRWDSFRYEWSGGAFGPPDSPVRFPNALSGVLARDTPVTIAERRGCDLNPIELDDAGRLSLLSFIWADQVERFRALDSAIELARATPAHIDKADAVEWLQSQLAQSQPGVATVVFHSVVLVYLTPESKERFSAIMHGAGSQATAATPLAWLSMEAGEAGQAEVRLTQWPGGASERIATATFHGQSVQIG